MNSKQTNGTHVAADSIKLSEDTMEDICIRTIGRRFLRGFRDRFAASQDCSSTWPRPSSAWKRGWCSSWRHDVMELIHCKTIQPANPIYWSPVIPWATDVDAADEFLGHLVLLQYWREYGQFLILDRGKFQVNSILLPHCRYNYASDLDPDSDDLNYSSEKPPLVRPIGFMLGLPVSLKQRTHWTCVIMEHQDRQFYWFGLAASRGSSCKDM